MITVKIITAVKKHFARVFIVVKQVYTYKIESQVLF